MLYFSGWGLYQRFCKSSFSVSGVDFWTSPYQNGTDVKFLVSSDYARDVKKYLESRNIPAKVKKYFEGESENV